MSISTTSENQAQTFSISPIRHQCIGKPALVPIPDQIPELLKQTSHWIVWGNSDPANNKGKLDKVPYNAKNKRMADPTESASWSTFDTAISTYRNGTFSGVGFVLDGRAVKTNDRGEDLFLHAFDLDDVLLQHGDMNAFADNRLSTARSILGDMYTEVSPSGVGVRIFALSTKKPETGKNQNGIEWYTKGRYLTVTGRNDGKTQIRELSAESIDAFINEFFRVRTEQYTQSNKPSETQNFLLGRLPSYLDGNELDEVTSRLLKSVLYEECPAHVDNLRSALFCLDPDMNETDFFRIRKGLWHLERCHEWEDAKNLAQQWASGELRAKRSEKYFLDGAGKALSKAEADAQFERQWASLKPSSTGSDITHATVFDAAKRAGWNLAQPPAFKTSRMDLLSLERGIIDISAAPPPKQQYVLSTFAAEKKVTVLAGLGGSSKTTLAMQLAVSVALGESFGDIVVAPGAVIGLFGEDDQDDIRRRSKAILEHRPEADKRLVQDRLRAFPLAGEDIKLTRLDGGNVRRSGVGDLVIQCAEDLKGACGVAVKLIIIDHARLVMVGDANASDHATELMAIATDIATRTGAAVMLLAHSPKESLGKAKGGEDSDANDVAGSAAFVNSARSVEVLRTMTKAEAKEFDVPAEEAKHYARLTVVKSNIGQNGLTFWFKRQSVPEYDTVLLVPASFNSQTSALRGKAQSRQLESRITAMIREANGEMTSNKLKTYATKKGKLQASQQDVARTLDELVQKNVVKRITVDNTNRGNRKVKIGTIVLELAEASTAGDCSG